MEETQATREKIAQAVRILHGMGLLEVWGHISGRVDDLGPCAHGRTPPIGCNA
jgi:hypothetical protein